MPRSSFLPTSARHASSRRRGPLAVFFVLLAIYSAIYVARGVRDPGVADGFYAYLYARSLAYDGDVDFRDDYALCGDAYRQGVDRGTGHLDDPAYPGPALVWVPLLTVARAVVPVGDTADPGVRGGCQGPRARFALAVAIPLGAAAMALAARVAQAFAARAAACLAAILFGVASSLPLYAAVFVSSSHVFEAAFAALLLFATARAVEQRHGDARARGGAALLLFVAAAGLTLQRLSDLAIVVVPLVAIFAADMPRRTRLTFATSVLGGVSVGVALTIALYIYLYGSPFVLPQGRHYVSFAHAHPLLVLFAPHGGLLYATPVAYLALGGTIAGWREPRWRPLVLAGLAAALGALLVAASPLDWHGKATFGARRLVVLTPLFVIAGAIAIDRLGRRIRRVSVRHAVGAALVLALGAPVVGAVLGVTTGETPLEEPFGAPSGRAFRAVAALGELAVAPARALYAARFGLPASSFGAATTDRHYRRSYRDLTYEPNVVDFRDAALAAASTGTMRTSDGLRIVAPSARVGFTAGWHHADMAILRLVAARGGRLTLSLVRPLGSCALGPLDVPAGASEHPITLAEGCFDSGLLALTFAGDPESGVTAQSLTLLDRRALPPPF